MNFYFKIWVTVFDGDDDAAIVSELEGQLSKISDQNSADYKKTTKLLTAARLAVDVKQGKYLPQEKVNSLLADDKRKHQEAHRSTLEELQAIQAKANLSKEERDELERRISETQSLLRTKEETSAQEREKLVKKHNAERESLSLERDSWKKRYTESTIKNTILSAAAGSTPKVINPEQILIILQPKTRLVEELGEDGKPTGEFIPKVSFVDKDKNKKTIVLDLSPEDAVKRMSEMEEHFNLFSADGQQGFGRFRAGKGKEIPVREIAKDPAAYREARKKGQLTF